jgi:hypothetical protein
MTDSPKKLNFVVIYIYVMNHPPFQIHISFDGSHCNVTCKGVLETKFEYKIQHISTVTVSTLEHVKCIFTLVGVDTLWMFVMTLAFI